MHAARGLLCGTALVALLAAGPRAAPGAAHRVTFDTDFGLPPHDGLALALALNSPELDTVGITTVAGNFNLARANADVLRMLEITHHENIPVHAGARRPLVHVKNDFPAASLIDPMLVKAERMVVDVDIDHSINYGVSVGGKTPWPGAGGARTMAVQHDLDWDRFITMFIDRVTRRPQSRSVRSAGLSAPRTRP